jgi:hypothetical protein
VREWYDAGFREFIFYDPPPYAGPAVPIAPPETVDELLHDTIPRLRREFSQR